MFRWINNVYKRHRKKILFTGFIVGGSYIVSKYAQWKFDNWQEAKIKEYTIEAKKHCLYESNQKTCTVTFMSFLPNLRNTIADTLKIDDVLEQLKGKPNNKFELWERLKILSFAQVLSSVISNVLLLVLLKVELNVMAGYMFRDYVDKEDGNPTNVVSEELNEVQIRYLNNIRYFLEIKLVELINDATHIVQESIGEVTLKEKISFEKLEQLINDMKQKLMSLSFDAKNDKHAFSLYMIDPEWASLDVYDAYSKMTSETINVLESADCANVINKCMETGFEMVLLQIKSSFRGYEEDPEAIVSIENCVKHDFYKPIELPLAKVVPLWNNMFHEIFKTGQNKFLDALFAENLLREYSTNIYEAFQKNYP